MEFGFGKSDITPRIGVQLYGYGAFLNRHSTAIRQRLQARAMAVNDGDRCILLVSCDLVGLAGEIVQNVRQTVAAETGLAESAICVHCTHTHSGPGTKHGIGQGEMDRPYLELLPRRIARACEDAVADLAPGELRYSVVPCEGLGYNRERDSRPALDEALREDWRPQLPDITDTQAHVLSVYSGDDLRGFASYFSCHPVVGGSDNTYIHGDFVGVATDLLERQTPGSTGLFLQGCSGNINSCVVHHPEQPSLEALDVLASRYARQIRPGLHNGTATAEGVDFAVQDCSLSHNPLPAEDVQIMLDEHERILADPDMADDAPELRRATVRAIALRRELKRQQAGVEYEHTVQIQALRIGEIVMVGAPFEITHRYKRTVQAKCDGPVFVMGLCNGAQGYLPEREVFEEEDNYAAKTVPYLLGYPPFAPSVEDEVTSAMVDIVGRVRTS
ncbi:MAG: neutral/alkaline non-lysosomal ceramidase N-terminal domain-containing protein [Trueperaceae bacterium]